MWTLGEKYNVLTPERAANVLLKRLARYDPFIYKRSKNRASVYVHFNNLPNALTHKLRISNHEEIERYGYKWQLRLDGLGHVTNKKYRRRYFDTIDALVYQFEKHYNRVEALNAELMEGIYE